MAESIFAQEGEQRLQMKELARCAEVSLATLYKHFPSKDHVLGAIALDRQQLIAAKADSLRFEGRTPGERAGDVMMEEFRTVQRFPEMAVALQRVANAPDRSTSEYIAGIRNAMERLVLTAIASGGEPATPEQRQLLPIFLAACAGAMNGWLSGTLSADQACAHIRVARRLIDLPPAVAQRYLLDE